MRKSKNYFKKVYSTAHKGLFTPKNKKKYVGKIPVIYRSKLELSWMLWFDKNPLVVMWSAEPNFIPIFYQYGRTRRYIVDIYAQIKDKNGNINKYIIEIKHSGKRNPPKLPKRKTKQYYYLVEEWNMNQRKWKAAEAYAENNNLKFAIFDEKLLKETY